MVNYTVESKSKAINHDNYIDSVFETHKNNCVTCWQCIFSGRNKEIVIVQDKLLCAKYPHEIANVNGKGTCDRARSRFKWYNFVSPIKKFILKKSGFDFNAR